MQRAKFITKILIADPDTGNTIEIEAYKHENGGIFAIDSSYLEQVAEDENRTAITDPFYSVNELKDEAELLILEGL